MNTPKLYELFLQSSIICTDTRNISRNCMFVALKGNNFNGNDFAIQALEQGAKYVIVDKDLNSNSNKIILVKDTLKTLQELANYHRKQLKTTIIALTGSNGKTTTKELLSAVLSTQYKTVSTFGNLNNHIGVPLTLLSIKKDTEIAIVEMGANHQKEIEILCHIAEPDFGLITNFGKAHLEGFGGIEGVIKGKSELYDHLKKHNKFIFVNEDDTLQIKQTKGYKNTISFGSKSDSNADLELLTSQPLISVNYKGTTVNSNLAGHYNFNNIAIAIAVGTYFKIDKNHIISAIENYLPTNNRSQIIELNGNKILMDAYNANPTSMMAALENFKQISHPDKVLFLGDMFELGNDAPKEHQAIVNYLENNPVEQVFLLGENFSKTKVSKSFIQQYASFQDLNSQFNKNDLKNKFILIKGSRGMALERLLDII
ncbi:UDP-N-acetylmuramoyl-tripeptide--D-alanyl-D-alanine ligase [Paucihalobacter sp.]|uniref:UDP-N-acetylmuramoyl-tripeptide--D-alanyl-D- alanine ligase n=1 Tax=Paucihalobacter sp. TaxID=2850405 RepID=UPI002FE2E620